MYGLWRRLVSLPGQKELLPATDQLYQVVQHVRDRAGGGRLYWDRSHADGIGTDVSLPGHPGGQSLWSRSVVYNVNGCFGVLFEYLFTTRQAQPSDLHSAKVWSRCVVQCHLWGLID